MPRLFSTSALDQMETAAQDDMQERARRLAAFKAATEGKVWQEQENGEWWLVEVTDMTRAASHQHAA